MSQTQRAFERGFDSGLREAIWTLVNESNLEGAMPLRLRLLAVIRPRLSARAAGEAMRASVLKKLRAKLPAGTA